MSIKRIATSFLVAVSIVLMLFSAACGEVTVSPSTDSTTTAATKDSAATVSTSADATQSTTDGAGLPEDTTTEGIENTTDVPVGTTATLPPEVPTTASRPTSSYAPEKTSQVVITTTVTTKPITLPPATTAPTVTLPPPPATTLPPVTTTTTKPTTTVTLAKTPLTPLAATRYYGYEYLQAKGSALSEVYLAIVAAVEAMDETVDVSTWNITPAQLADIFNAYEADYPQQFWCEHAYGYSTIGSKVVEISLQYNMTESQRNTARTAFNKAVDDILSTLSGNMSDYEKELRIHDALVNSIDYRITGSPDDYTAYGALVKKKGVCESYARAFQYLCYRAGIRCLLISGSSMGVGHMWNVVSIDGTWYQMDVTWDDPIGPADSSLPYYDYFNVSTAEILRTHSIADEQLYPIPNCTQENGDYFTREGLVMGKKFDTDVVVRALVRFAESGKSMAQVSTSLSGKQFTDGLMSQFWDIVGAANAQISDPSKKLPTQNASLSFSVNEDTGVAHFFIRKK